MVDSCTAAELLTLVEDHLRWHLEFNTQFDAQLSAAVKSLNDAEASQEKLSRIQKTFQVNMNSWSEKNTAMVADIKKLELELTPQEVALEGKRELVEERKKLIEEFVDDLSQETAKHEAALKKLSKIIRENFLGEKPK